MLNIDHTERLVGLDRYRELIGAVLAASDADELWVEWKSTLDLQKKEGQFAIARGILAFANRLPDDAQACADGYAYLVVGAEPGKVHGVTEVDIAKLSPGLERYCGPVAGGPRYQFTYVTYDTDDGEKQILIVEVAPPHWGDTIHSLRTDYDNTPAGTIFIRRPGRTERANALEMQLLVERARRQSIQLSVTASEGVPLRPVSMSPERTEEWLAREAAAVRDRGPRRAPADPGTAEGASTGVPVMAADFLRLQESFRAVVPRGFVGDPRTPSEYSAEADAYLRELAEALPAILLDRAADRLVPLRLQLVNRTAQNLSLVELVVELPQGIAVTEKRRGYDRTDIPPRPVRYGEKSAYPIGLPSAYLGAGILGGTRPIAPRPRVQRTAQGLEVTFPGVDVRPRRSAELDCIVLVVPESVGTSLCVTWSATAKNVDAVIDGTLTLPIEGEPWTLDQLLWVPSSKDSAE